MAVGGAGFMTWGEQAVSIEPNTLVVVQSPANEYFWLGKVIEILKIQQVV